MFKNITASTELGLIATAEKMGAGRPFLRRRHKRGGMFTAVVELPNKPAGERRNVEGRPFT